MRTNSGISGAAAFFKLINKTMKKLIKELTAKLDSASLPKGRYGDGWLDGFTLALEIVRSHNPWTSVETLPPIDEKEPDFSIDVILTDGEYCRVGYYAFRTGSWIIHRYFKKPITHWSYLPEIKNDNPS